MKLLKTLLVLACALASVPALAADAGTLRFGLEAQYPPFESKGPNGELQGLPRCKVASSMRSIRR
jgi:lysine/arginine/ornithine transport system substrate-binding protein